jgi:hypothetical protein
LKRYRLGGQEVLTSPSQLLIPLEEFLENLRGVMSSLPDLQCLINLAAYEGTNRNPQSLQPIFFLRFVLPYITHPAHQAPRNAVVLSSKIIQFIAGGSVRDASTWPIDVMSFCTRWKATMTANDFFGGITRVRKPTSWLSQRGNVAGLCKTLLNYIRLNLALISDPTFDKHQLGEFLGDAAIK